MSRYFFHVRLDSQVVMDDDGITFDTMAAAIHEAETSARELLAEAILADKSSPDMISVYDDLQQKIAEVDFRDLIPLSLR